MRRASIGARRVCSTRAGVTGDVEPEAFRRYGSARKLYNFHVDNAGRLLMRDASPHIR